MLLFGMMSVLEMYLASMVDACYPNESFVTNLSPGRLQKAQRLFEAQRENDEEIALVNCLLLTDKTSLLLQDQGLVSFFGFGPDGRHFFKGVEKLRNRLAHAVDLFGDGSCQDLIRTIMSLNQFLDDCEEKGEEFRRLIANRQ